jgi:DNA (cytosine-5)-methyltransferase 1
MYCSRQLTSKCSPGEVLPDFPPFTHADPRKADSVLPPWVSVNSVIRNIPRGAPNHDLELMEAKPLNYTPWSGDSIAPRCITTHGGQNYHPSGKRGFTNREYACLQGFPMNHRFGDVNVKKQIGNAVPPCVAKVLFSWIKKALEKADGFEPEDAQSEIFHAGYFQTEAIVLD